MWTAKRSTQRRQASRGVTQNRLEENLPTTVQKSYFMLSDAERAVLNTALGKYQPGQSEPIFVGGKKQLKPALRLMSAYRLVIEEIEDGKLISSYTRWVDAVHTNGTDNPGVYLNFSSRFKRIWLEAKKRLLEHVAEKPVIIGLRSQYAIRLYNWAKKYVKDGTRRISLSQLRKVLGWSRSEMRRVTSSKRRLYPSGANLRQRALDVAIAGINEKTDLNIVLLSLERSAHRRVTALTFSIPAPARLAFGDK